MAVSGNFRVDTRPYSGYAEPSLPQAAWIAQAGIAGDASAGLLIINFLFQLSANRRVTESYNLEQISIDISDATDEDFLMSTLNMDSLSPARPASPQKWIWELGTDGESDAALKADKMNGLPLWLGAPTIPAGSSSAGLRFTTDNVNGRLYAITVQGYIWGPRSVLAPGGPQRPVNGFFGG